MSETPAIIVKNVTKSCFLPFLTPTVGDQPSDSSETTTWNDLS